MAENIYLAAPADARPAYGRMHSWAEETLAAFKLDVPLAALTGSLSLAQRQLLEVAKALLTRPKVLLLDEPTTALGPEDVGRLHTLVLEQARAGVGIVYVSHRLPEVLAVADRVTVLRDGVAQGTFEAASVSEDALVTLMIGRPLTVAFPERRKLPEDAEVMLAVSGLKGERFGPVDLEVRKGEILGIAGAEGNGQVPFLRALAGSEPATGTASCGGAKIDMRSPAGSLRAGVVLLSGDRRGEALFPVLSVRANSTIQILRRLAPIGIVLRGRERRAMAGLVEQLQVRMASPEQPVQSLSGGNQQKVSLISSFLRGDVKVILAEEPTQGVDVGARFDIYEALRAKSEEGITTVVKSSDPIELSGLCDRVVVMSRGRIVEEIPRHELGERRIVEAIVGSRVGVTAPRERRDEHMKRNWLPLILMTALIVALGAYTAAHQSAFLSKENLNSLLLEAMPLILVSLGQAVALLVGGFDVSVAALMTMVVVVASFTIPATTSGIALVPGVLALIGVGIATGLFNAFLIRGLRLPSIVATLGTLSILEGWSLWLRSYPSGAINTDVTGKLTSAVGFVPLAFVGVVLLAALGDFGLYRSRTGLGLRAVGLDETSSRRLGMSTGRTIVLAFVVCSVLATLGGFYLAAEVQVGSPIIGNEALESIAAAVLGGASLAGGRGSFFGTLLAAFFLTEINNILPLFQQPTEYADMTIGALILLALLLYQSPVLIAKFRTSRRTVEPAEATAG